MTKVTVNQEILDQLKAILFFYPREISPSEYKIESNLTLHGLKPKRSNAGREIYDSTIPIFLENILNQVSIQDFIFNDYAEANRELYFSSKLKHPPGGIEIPRVNYFRIPTQKLKTLLYTEYSIAIQAYIRRRSIFNLLKICAQIDPKVLKSNKYFKKQLLNNPQEKNSFFLKAIRIEPCLLQTKFGIEAIQKFELWDLTQIENLGKSLNPVRKAKLKADLENDHKQSNLRTILLILSAIERRVNQITDTELLNLLSDKDHKYCSKNYELDNFRRLRNEVFSKK